MTDTIVVKMGGIAADNLTQDFFQQVKQWQTEDKRVVVVHGGGHYISEMMQQLQIPVEIKDGLRVTNQQTLDVTRMVLLGQVQPMITTLFQQAGLPSVGLNAGCDQLIEGELIDKSSLGYVGAVSQINKPLIEMMSQKKHIPIIAPLGITKNGQWLNINADDVACKVAVSLQASELFLLTDVPGIKKDDCWLNEVSIDEVEQLKKEQVVTGGMLPKLNSAKKAVMHGVKTVHINNSIHTAGTKICEPQYSM